MNDKLIEVTIHTSLNKHNLLFGADRELILVLGLICAVLIFLGMTIQTAIIGVVIWIFFSIGLRMMAKEDPIMRHIYIKQLKYKSFYNAHSTPFVRETK